MYLINSPFFIRWYYRNVTFNKSRKEKRVYLTFDDGPIPKVTPFILDILAKYDIKATFFCVGENISKHPAIFNRLRQEGHRIGNHTHNHLRGWDSSDAEYLANVAQCHTHTQSNLFRPPYGRAKKSQLKELEKNYQIIFWDVLSGDFDTKLSPEKCYRNVIRYTKNGSIIVFHDNIKAIPRVEYALPKVIEKLLAEGYSFGLL